MDMLQIKGSDVLRFPDNSGFLFNHIWTKTLSSSDANVFAFKRAPNRLICPVRGLEMYLNISGSLGVQLAPDSVSPRSLESTAAQSRLKLYTSSCSGRLSSKNLTIHGFCTGAAVSLALEGVSLHEIMHRVGWKSSKTALHYIKLKQVLNRAGAAAKLVDLPLGLGESYKRINNLKGFTLAFLN